MAKEKICGIYSIINKISGKMYIGQSVDIYSRWKGHWKQVRQGSTSIIHNAMRSYGKHNFDMHIIELCDKNIINEREIFWINFYNTYNNGYNLTTGGEGVKNKIFTQDEKESYRTLSIGSNKPILQFDFNGNLIKEWFGVREAGKKTGLNPTTILACLKNRKNCFTAYGYIWIYKEIYDKYGLNIGKHLQNVSNNEIYKINNKNQIVCIYESINELINKNPEYKASSIYASNNRNGTYKGFIWKLKKSYNPSENYSKYFIRKTKCKIINQYDLNMNLIKEFSSLKEASECLNISCASISSCLHKKQKSTKGFIFQFA